MRLASLPFHKVRTIIVTLGELNYAEPRFEVSVAVQVVDDLHGDASLRSYT